MGKKVIPMTVGEKWVSIVYWFKATGNELWENSKKDKEMEKFANKIQKLINKFSRKLRKINEKECVYNSR